MPASSRRFLLRERTAAGHTAVDAAVGSFDTLEQYGIYLQGLYSFRHPLEVWLASIIWPAQFNLWRPKAISDVIIADMSDLNLTARHGGRHIPSAVDLETLIGTLYVLEGSSLGARLLVKRAAGLGLDDTYGARHLHRQARSDGWSIFLQLLDSPPAMDMDKVVAASRAVFAHAETAFKETLYA